MKDNQNTIGKVHLVVYLIGLLTAMGLQLVTAQSSVNIQSLFTQQSSESGQDEIYLKFIVDGVEQPITETTSMNENDTELETLSINKSFNFNYTFAVEVWEDDGATGITSGDDKMGGVNILASTSNGMIRRSLTQNGGEYILTLSKSGLVAPTGNGTTGTTSGSFERGKSIANDYMNFIRVKDTMQQVDFTDANGKFKPVCSIPSDGVVGGLVPDGFYSQFLSACLSHDYCYGSPWLAAGISNGKAVCDAQFHTDMLKICDDDHNDGSPRWFKCRTYADIFHVAMGHQKAFNGFSHGQNTTVPQNITNISRR